MATNRNRTAGHNWERYCVNLIKHIFPKAVTSRMESKSKDDAGVDICNTEGYNIQCKNMSTNLKYDEVLNEMPQEEDTVNVIFLKKTKKTGKVFREIGQYAILRLEDFISLLSKSNDDNSLKSKVELLTRHNKHLKSIIESQEDDLLFLAALKECGVDNWSGYGEAYDLLKEWEEEDRKE